MILPIVQYGDPILRQKGRRLTTLTPEIHQLIADMFDTMRAAKGVGLAAQQVGHALQLAIIDITGITERPSQLWLQQVPTDPELLMPLVLINPEIQGTKTKIAGNEGCLSFPGLGVDINRSQRIYVRTQTLSGAMQEFDAGGLLGRAIQHEYDHLQGKLFIDYLTTEQKKEHKETIDLIRFSTEQTMVAKKAYLPSSSE
jgi:peptide deformylase